MIREREDSGVRLKIDGVELAIFVELRQLTSGMKVKVIGYPTPQALKCHAYKEMKERYGGFGCVWDLSNTYESRLTKEQTIIVEKIGDRLNHPLRRPVVETITTPDLPGAPIEPDPPKKKSIRRKTTRKASNGLIQLDDEDLL